MYDDAADDEEADGSDASLGVSDNERHDNVPDDCTTDEDDNDDYMTDDGVEQEVDHVAESITWKPSKKWYV